jgi:uncharacterized protein
MPYLIDGHNLIPHIPGLSLEDLEDEMALVQILAQFAVRQRVRIEVYFDHAPAARSGSRSFGVVKVVFVRQDSTADRAIISRLGSLNKEAKNWTVVTSDREILAEARGTHSRTIPSSTFARLLAEGDPGQEGNGSKTEDPKVSSGEVDYWLEQFNKD